MTVLSQTERIEGCHRLEANGLHFKRLTSLQPIACSAAELCVSPEIGTEFSYDQILRNFTDDRHRLQSYPHLRQPERAPRSPRLDG